MRVWPFPMKVELPALLDARMQILTMAASGLVTEPF
jgi:hypothetical protein